MSYCNHNWSEWQTLEVVDGITYQARMCNNCGQVDTRELRK